MIRRSGPACERSRALEIRPRVDVGGEAAGVGDRRQRQVVHQRAHRRATRVAERGERRRERIAAVDGGQPLRPAVVEADAVRPRCWRDARRRRARLRRRPASGRSHVRTSTQRSTGSIASLRSGLSDASPSAPRRSSAASPAARPATGPPNGGCSRVVSTGSCDEPVGADDHGATRPGGAGRIDGDVDEPLRPDDELGLGRTAEARRPASGEDDRVEREAVVGVPSESDDPLTRGASRPTCRPSSPRGGCPRSTPTCRCPSPCRRSRGRRPRRR